MANKKIKTAEYQPIKKLNLAKNLDKFAILKLRNKHSTYKKLVVQCSADTFFVNQSLVLRITICGKNRHLRQAPNRYMPL